MLNSNDLRTFVRIFVRITAELKKIWAYSHKEEASTDMIRHWTHPDVAVFLQILRRDHCLPGRHTLQWVNIHSTGTLNYYLYYYNYC